MILEKTLMKRTAMVLLTLLTALTVISCQRATDNGKSPAGSSDKAVLRIGYMICDSLEETKSRFEPLTRHLSTVTGMAVIPVYLNTFDVPEAFERGELDVTHTNSLIYVMMKDMGLEPLAGEKRGSLGFRSAGGIAVKADSPIKKLEDLKGKRMVFGPMLAPTGYLAQYELLLDAGIDPEVDLDYYAIPAGAYKHEKVVYGVWMGAYDAAAIPLLDLEIMEDLNKVGKGDLRVIAFSDPIPYCVFGVSSRVPAKIADSVRTALMNLTTDQTVPLNGEVVSILKAAQVDGFVPIEDSDFDRVREMARKTNMPPYQVY
jgi:phosphonate transport system substrate-binding protein